MNKINNNNNKQDIYCVENVVTFAIKKMNDNKNETEMFPTVVHKDNTLTEVNVVKKAHKYESIKLQNKLEQEDTISHNKKPIENIA